MTDIANKKLSREDIAKRDIGVTRITPKLSAIFVTFFCLCIFLYPLFQIGYEYFGLHQKLPQPFEIFHLPRTLTWKQLLTSNNRLVDFIHNYEEGLENQSLLKKYLLSPVQTILTRELKTGDEKVIVGSDHWLFYKVDMDYLTSPGFLNPNFQMNRVKKENFLQPDPVKAIVDFNHQLANQGIQLIVFPMPVKPMLYPEKLSSRLDNIPLPLQNESFSSFEETLTRNSVLVFNPGNAFAEAKEKGIQVYLQTDTHWTPDGVILTARELAKFVRSHVVLPLSKASSYSASEMPTNSLGDMVSMLKLNNPKQFIPMEEIILRKIYKNGVPVSSDTNSNILLMGDSFLNIYSTETDWWGYDAGLMENLCFELQRPIQTIVVNGGGAYGVRENLARELKKDKNYLACKKVIIWEFADRELISGDWKLINLNGETVGNNKQTAQFFVPEDNKQYIVTAKVLEVSEIPKPGSSPYRDHVMSLHLGDLQGAGIELANAQALVYIQSMRDQTLTPAASLRPGQTIQIRLKNWNSVEKQYGGLNRSELDNQNILLQEPCWGELINVVTQNSN